MGSGKRKTTLHDLSKQTPTSEEVLALIDAVGAANPPIVTAILGGALLEHDLESILRPKFKRRDDANWARLTSENGPLNTLAQKISAAYGFGLIDEETRRALSVAKNIRNVFAHSKRLIDFENALIRGELATLQIPAAKKSGFAKNLQKIRSGKMAGQVAFIGLCLVLSLRINKQRFRTEAARSRRKRNVPGPILAAFLKGLSHGVQSAPNSPQHGFLFGLDPKALEGLPARKDILEAFSAKEQGKD